MTNIDVWDDEDDDFFDLDKAIDELAPLMAQDTGQPEAVVRATLKAMFETSEPSKPN